MRRLFKYIYLFFATLSITAVLTNCSDEMPIGGSSGDTNVCYNSDGTLSLQMQIEIPELSVATMSRSMGDTPNFRDLGIYMLVFEEGQGLTQNARLSAKDVGSDGTHNNSGLVTFNAKLEPTENKVVIHLIATDQPDFGKQITYGFEERVITSLYTNDNHEAYWQRIDIGTNVPSCEQADMAFGSEDFDVNEEQKAQAITQKLSHVPMVRNFCRVSIEKDASVTNFSLTGLYVLNTVDRGSVAPYVASNDEDDRFINYYHKDNSGSYQCMDYRELTDEKHYIGHLPAGVTIINTVSGVINTKSESSDGNVEPVYFYERPARTNSMERTFAIIRGIYNGNVNYYKLDIGHVYDDISDAVIGLFEYYNLLRNFDYHIRISSVDGEGYGTLQEAANGAVFNNFSASVEARNMKSISDGDEYIYVSHTSYVFTKENQVLELLGQYRTDVGTVTGGNVRNNLLNCVSGPGNVIKNYTATTGANNINSFNTYRITSNAPTDQLERQEFYVYRGRKGGTDQNPIYGLYRIVTLFLHKPWQFRHIDTFPGLWDSMEDMPSWEWSEESREIGQSKGAPLTLFFELPPDLPQAIFPLEFVIESDRQNIQNAYQGNAVVRSVPAEQSLFYSVPSEHTGKATTSRIQYVKTVTWEDYFGEWSDELVGHGSVIVRCRFLTITDLAQDGIGGTGENGKSETTLRVYNEYFTNDKGQDFHEDGFIRDTQTSDPSPRSWNFNDAIWDQILLDANSGTRDNFQLSNTSIMDLGLVEGGTRTMSTGTMTFGIESPVSLRYVQTSNNNDKFVHTHNYPYAQERKVRIEITCTTTTGTNEPPRITYNNVKGGASAMKTPVLVELDESGELPIYRYEFDVPASITGLDIEISQPTGTPMRFYKIDFYPRWDEYTSLKE